MQLKYLQTILEAQDHEYKIVALCWSPNNQKLAVATCDRQILLFDEEGKKRDKFATKPFDPEAGKKSYVITAIAFSPDSTKIAVAQTDCIVYVYKIGDKWGDKKAICNKFPQPAPVTCLLWLLTGPIVCGLQDGRVRALQVKSNKSQSLFASDSLVVALAPNSKGTGFLSGHIDGNIIRFFVTHDPDNEGEAQGRAALHSVPPFALAWAHGYIFAAGCDKRVCVYSNTGKTVKTFDYSRDNEESDFGCAISSPSGQAVTLGSFDRLRTYIWNTRKSIWDESPPKSIKNFYTVTSLAWKRDGSKVTCGSLCGAVMVFESVLKRSVWKDKFEITYVGASQVLVKPLDGNERGVILRSQHGGEIDDVKIMGRDSYLVAKTRETLLVADLLRNLLSEVPWNNPDRNEKFYFENPNVCLVFNAGELTLIEYGNNEVLCSVRTEFANPHVISVRLNERGHQLENKKLAYLLDLKTVLVMDLVTGAALCQIGHDSKIDWLELNETGEKLLFRDKKQRLLLTDISSRSKQTIYTDVTFVQWVESSDVAVAQSGNTLAIWYNIELPQNPTVMTVRGEVTDVIRNDGKTEAICVDGQHVFNVELDEGLVEFGTAVNDSDYSRAVLFLESMGRCPEADAMWHTLLAIAVKQQNLVLAERCFSALGDVSSAHFLQETMNVGREFFEKHKENPNNSPQIWARLSILYGDLSTAENIYLEQGDIEGALDMYKRLHKWQDVLRLADQRHYPKLSELKSEYMQMLNATAQYDKVGQALENEGKSEEALNMYLKSNKLLRIPHLLAENPSLLHDQAIVGRVLKNLLKQELYEAAADIYEKLDKNDLAMECYRKGKLYNKAVELARVVSPEQVVQLEEEWGDTLVENKQMDAAINHFIEAGCTLKALEAAVSAKQWKKAVHIIKVIEDPDMVRKYYEIIAQYFAGVKDYYTAEKLYAACQMYKEAVEMYNEAGQWDKAHAIASKYLDQVEVSDMYITRAEELEEAGKYRDAEKLYLSVNSPDLAIAMYKRAEQYDNMIRLVEKYHPNLLQTTHLHLGQQLEGQGKHRAAEIHYLACGEWKAAMNMYRTLNMWEEAYRVAKQNGGTTAANQVAFLWSRTLPIDSAVRLLNKYGILEPCVNYACETYQFEFAFQLCKELTSKIPEVHYKYAMALEDDGKFAEAETEFVLADKPKEAVLMYVHAQNWIAALRVAESHLPASVPEVLHAQACHCFKEKQFGEFEVLLLRAQMPETIVQKYKAAEMWIDALRVCKDYLPHLYPALQAEYGSSHHNKTTDANIETLLSRANEWALAGQHKQAIECLLQVNVNITEGSIVKRALLRAADMVNKFLFGQDALDVIKVLSPRLIDIGEHSAAAQLYISMELMKEAIDAFIAAEDWTKARKVAKELEPAYESYVETKYKDRLLKKGDVEQLADVDIIGALDLLAEQGQWIRCIEKAKAHNVAPILHKYVALYAAKLLKDNFIVEALNLYATHGAPAMPQNFNIYNHIASEMFGLPDLSEPEAYAQWEQLRQMLLEVNEGLKTSPNISVDTKAHFRDLLLIAHFYALRCACRQSASLKSIGVKISTALLRYTDIIPADKAFYEAGKDLKEVGRNSEAFVFLNHYLDLCEAIEEGEGQLVDHSDLVQTDFPSNIPLPARLFLADDPKEHDSIREWVLAVSMDQKVEQVLPTDDRQLYESALQPEEQPCLVTGYPIRKQAVTFANSTFQASREAWAKLSMAAKMVPDSHVPGVISFVQKWCGPASN
ncbi:intraflagellar transport protein 172 homolog [Anthonomus grandis grandis]|uniref:intraflagellar transport protein 172 homolog n=1 Tax=Anthonomus grandis grandis TaxID=2921223 RepID=UPI00216623C8|nr:intraflagellar transport protein 172 homolog [Anthonomus grandis grandis]